MAYDVVVTKAALRDLRSLAALPKKTRKQIDDAIRALASDPRPHGVKKLEGAEHLHRVRVGNHRIIYKIEDDKLVVLVVRVRDRRDAYR